MAPIQTMLAEPVATPYSTPLLSPAITAWQQSCWILGPTPIVRHPMVRLHYTLPPRQASNTWQIGFWRKVATSISSTSTDKLLSSLPCKMALLLCFGVSKAEVTYHRVHSNIVAPQAPLRHSNADRIRHRFISDISVLITIDFVLLS